MENLERYLGWVRERCEGLPDKRRGTNSQYSMADISLAALSVFFMQSPSFLAHQRALDHGRGRSNCQTLFRMTKIPSDNHIRKIAARVHYPPGRRAKAGESRRREEVRLNGR